MAKLNIFEQGNKYVLAGSTYKNRKGIPVKQVVVRGSNLNFAKTSIDARQAVVFKKACEQAGITINELFNLLIEEQIKTDKSAIADL